MIKIMLYILFLTIYSINAMNSSINDLDKDLNEDLTYLEWDTILNPSELNIPEEKDQQIQSNIFQDLKKNEPTHDNQLIKNLQPNKKIVNYTRLKSRGFVQRISHY